ncbi:TrkA family potassium uptake protein [Acinetobacter sp. S40]|uniref:potassium channel family protein n=1 Tax=unclassified Acinetobacter TaxID=196816 RepID=UPI00190A9C7E|nr:MULTISPECIES: TrkA family potassium uptake protein [unclassified Acinetobacter]MBJ9984488.1 TrkA family potassium uptake protein [Acinetobacter sp. S40]MBK0062205.1 TrkA family potassium uptake protein [Acinetobacter sp. S55]MBK0066009.1 TrkA family potassium uptake protein [Acinetobacter sp. S54]
MAQFAVIGLGSFGATVAIQLAQLKHDVIGIDTIKRNVEDVSDQLTHAVIADASDEHVLEELNIKNCAAVVVAIGEDIEASILCVLHLKNLGVPKIWVKAKTKAHHMILSHLHVDKIIHPEEDMGVRVAQALNYPMVSRYMALNDDHFIVKIEIPKHLNGVHLLGLIDATQHVRTILLQRGKDIIYDPDPAYTVQSKDILIVEGHLEPLKKLSKRFLSHDETKI